MSGGSEAALRADPELVARHVRGWSVARETAPPVAEGEGWRIDVSWPEQRVRHIFAAPCETLRSVAAAAREPWTFVKLFRAPDEALPLLPPGWKLQPTAFFMTTPLAACAPAAIPAGASLLIEEARAVILARIAIGGDAEAAIGRIAIVGEDAIFDRIVVSEAHRRRGHGRAIMAALTVAAIGRGARFGLLVATGDGRALYATLGWRLVSLYTSAYLPPPG